MPDTLSLKGQLLIAMPMMGDERFFESVIYMIEHNDQGAMGLIVNQPFEEMRLKDVIGDLNLEANTQSIHLSERVAERHVVRGGPVEKARGFVLHTNDYYSEGSSVIVTDKLHLTANIDILRAIAFEDIGPQSSLLALGYCGWAEGQLEAELSQNSWLTASCPETLIFSDPFEKRYDNALAVLGINRATLSAQGGTA